MMSDACTGAGCLRAEPSRTTHRTARGSQVVIALSGGEVIYFELNAMGQLMETEKRDMTGDVACLDIAPVPEGRQRSRFLAVGSYDSTARDCVVFCDGVEG